ncbi:predicted protein [Nematostella vectensis]|uniref:G-protein coupled receptors family 1 profile domain-containing protein n=1 Tax=Nematostella vectensis TaxID=45351 RepID=A7SMC7_NEMVE|nr:predicted protein [Nematostella vectensis]|eukprot:XP_001627263.1 predicted protein [Nematostella vectensis]
MQMYHGVPMVALNIISCIFGSIGNVLVCATIYTTTGLQTISNFFLVSMSIADLTVTLVTQPLFAWFLGARIDDKCSPMVEFLFRLFSNVSCAVSVIHLCLISVDRCLMVTKPHSFDRIMTKCKFRSLLVFAWTLPIVYAVLRLTVSKSATSLFTVAVMALCYVIIIVCYTLIICQVYKQRRLMRSRQGSAKRRKSRTDVERRVAMTIAIVIVVFTICWFPIIYLRSKKADRNSGVAYNWARTFALCNSAMNPWIYCFRIPEFRAGYKRLCIKCSWGTVAGRGGADFDVTHTSDSEATQYANIPKYSKVSLANCKPRENADEMTKEARI